MSLVERESRVRALLQRLRPRGDADKIEVTEAVADAIEAQIGLDLRSDRGRVISNATIEVINTDDPAE